jgi:NDP-sugar pyrophosphorylase family protein
VASPQERSIHDHDAPGADVCGIVLAGSYHWGDGDFERMLRGLLLAVAQTPLICYPLRWLRTNGVREATICANSGTPAVRGYLGNGDRLSMELSYFEDHEPRGPAGCVRDAARLSTARTLVVCEGALVPSLDLSEVLDAHERSGAPATVVVETDRRRHAVRSEQYRLPGGVYVFDREVAASIPERGFQDIKQGLLDRLYTNGERVLTHEVAGISPRVLDYPTYTSVSRWLIGRAIERPDFLAAHVHVGEGLHHPTAEVDPTAQLIGPVLVGPRARIEAGAVVVGPTSIGADSVVERGALVCRSILLERCVVGSDAAVDAALLADDAVVAAGERIFSESRIMSQTTAPSDPPTFASPDPVRVPASFALPFARPAGRGSKPVILPSSGQHFGEARA